MLQWWTKARTAAVAPGDKRGPFDHAVQPRRDGSAGGQEAEEVSQDGNGLFETHAAHSLTQVLDESFQIKNG
jgi:hypothetical protein